MAQSEGSEAVSCISSEEDLRRIIELGSWYDSEDESSSETEDTDSGSDHNHDEVGLNPISLPVYYRSSLQQVGVRG